MNCDCDTLKCEIDALKANVDELFSRSDDLREELLNIKPTIIAFVADCGTAGANQEAMAMVVNSFDPEYVVLGGDINYPDGSDADADESLEWANGFIDAEKALPVIGNHDDQDDRIPFSENFLYRKFPYVLVSPKYDYSFVVPGRDLELFFVYDGYRNDDDISPLGISGNLSEQARLSERIAASKCTNKIIFSHRTIAGPAINGPGDRYSDDGINNIDLPSLGVKAIFSGHTHTAWHARYTSGLLSGLHLVDCSATTESPRAFESPLALIGAASGLDLLWKYDEETRYAVKISVFKSKIRVEFWSFDVDIHHAFDINL